MSDRHELISRYLDAALTDEQFADLVAWIKADTANAAEFARACGDHSNLRDLWRGEDVREFFDDSQTDGLEQLTASIDSATNWPVSPGTIAELLDESEVEAERRLDAKKADAASQKVTRPTFKRERQERTRRPEPIVIPWSVVYAVGTAALVGCVQLVHGLWSEWEKANSDASVRQAVVAQVAPAATIVDSVDAMWNVPTISTRKGTQLEGGRLVLASGIVELEFGGGARLVVEGPSVMELLSADRMKLLQGKVVSIVPREAIGFTIETPSAMVIDLGTEFGVTARQDGASEVHVLDGVVELVAGATDEPSQKIARSRLTAGSAVEIDKQGRINELALHAEQFHRNVPSTIVVQKEVKASFDVRLVDLDGDGRGDRMDPLNQPPPVSEDFIGKHLLQTRVGVGEKNSLRYADEDARRYGLKFEVTDAHLGRLPDPHFIDSVNLSVAISDKSNVGLLAADLYGLHDQQVMEAGPSCFEATAELLSKGAVHSRTRTDTAQRIDVTKFVKEQLREGKSNLIFRFQAAGGEIPNTDGVENVYVFHTLHTDLEHLAPKLLFSIREYTRTSE